MLDAAALLSLLERNRERLPSRWLLVGAPHDLALADCPGQVAALSTHHGQWQQGRARGESWFFGYDDHQCVSGWDAVLVLIPKARQELMLRLAFAQAMAAQGGLVLLAGHKKEGIASGGKRFAQTFSRARKWDSARHCQLWGAEVSPDQAFRSDDWMQCAPTEVEGVELSLCHLPGLFAEGRVDEGTALLLSTFDQAPRGPVLDFACGNGVIGAWLKAQWPSLSLTATDVQWQAVTCARKGLGDRAQVLAGDGLEPVSGAFGLMVSNPPFHQGVGTEYGVTDSFLRSARAHLLRNGELRLVANRFLPWVEPIESTLGPVTVLAENRRFHVLQAFRR